MLVPTNSRDDPGYQSEWDYIRRHALPTEKDRAELADLGQRHQNGTLTAQEERHLLALLARVRGLHLQKLAELRKLVPDHENVHLAGLRGEAIGEFDGINMAERIFIEDKSARGLTRVNPTTGQPSQSSGSWADTQIYNKTVKRIQALKTAKYTYPPGSPTIEQIRNFRRLHFRVDADTPDVRIAVDDAVNRLRVENPSWEFTTQYGSISK